MVSADVGRPDRVGKSRSLQKQSRHGCDDHNFENPFDEGAPLNAFDGLKRFGLRLLGSPGGIREITYY